MSTTSQFSTIKMTKYYVLKGRKVYPAESLLDWALNFEQSNRIVKKDSIEGVEVSTVFLGLDHNWGDGPPLIFETITFSDSMGEVQVRCTTYEQAEEMHENVCKIVRAAQSGAEVVAMDAITRIREHAKTNE
jgi:hypothetical protein